MTYVMLTTTIFMISLTLKMIRMVVGLVNRPVAFTLGMGVEVALIAWGSILILEGVSP